jgi:hypothetical protein
VGGFLIVSGADAAYFPLARELFASIETASRGGGKRSAWSPRCWAH